VILDTIIHPEPMGLTYWMYIFTIMQLLIRIVVLKRDIAACICRNVEGGFKEWRHLDDNSRREVAAKGLSVSIFVTLCNHVSFCSSINLK
jgi:hypothetical protein